MQHYDCGNCGANTQMPAEQLSTKCAFCDSPIVLSDDAIKGPTPDFVAPFVIEQSIALDKLSVHLKQQWLAPDAVRQAAEPDRLRAVQVPFFMFDATAKSKYNADIGINWTESYTTEERNSEGEMVTVTKTRTHTEWFSTEGSHVYEYRKQLICGSKGVKEEDTNSIEPFDIGKAIPYDPSLLANVLAEQFQISKDAAEKTCVQELKALELKNTTSFLPGSSSRSVHVDTEVDVQGVSTILLPLYIANYKHNGQLFHLLVNGQSGQVAGPVPRSHAKVIMLITAIILFLFSTCCFVLVVT